MGRMSGRMTYPSGSTFFLLAALAAVFAAFVALTGGIDTTLFGIPVRSRSWERPATVATVLAGAGLFVFRREVWTLLSKLGLQIATLVRLLAGPLPVMTACVA